MSVAGSATVALFPGQGSIAEGAGREWCRSPHFAVVAEISSASGTNVEELLLSTPTDQLVRTDRAQIATFALSLVGWRHFLAHGGSASTLAGHSLGELSALVAAGVISIEDGSRLVSVRGAAMRDAAERTSGSMVALMGPSDGALERLSELPDIWIANINGPGQIVVSGTLNSLGALTERARDLGWKRATALAVGGAFHSPLMAPAQDRLNDALADTTFHDTSYEIVANVDGQPRRGGDAWRDLLSRQLTSPVQFVKMMESLSPTITTGVEMPPGSILCGLAKRIREFSALAPLEVPAP